MNDIQVNIILEYIRNKYQSLETDYQRVRERIQLYDLDPNSLQDFIICQTRLDTAAEIFRTVNELLVIFGNNDND